MKDLQALKNELLAANPNSNEMFKEMVDRSMDELDLTNKDVARALGVTSISVARWRDGSTAPHPKLRPIVYQWLIRLIDRN